MIAISTLWNSARSGGWEPAVRELVQLGYKHVALDSDVLHPDAGKAGRAVRAVRGKVTALFAPTPRSDSGGAPQPTLAAPRDAARRIAVKAAVAAADAAVAAGTDRVILRVGKPPSLRLEEREKLWAERLQAEGASDALRQDVRTALIQERGDRERGLESLCRALYDLVKLRPDVRWFLETPLSPTSLPLPDEAEMVLGELPAKRVGYWHDSGNAARLATLGVAPQDEWLGRLAPRCAGVTLADWSPIADRMPPGSGSVQWRSLRFQVRENMTRVLALDPEYPSRLIEDTLREVGNLGF